MYLTVPSGRRTLYSAKVSTLSRSNSSNLFFTQSRSSGWICCRKLSREGKLSGDPIRNSEHFLGAVQHLFSAGIPSPTARMRQLLRFRQISLTRIRATSAHLRSVRSSTKATPWSRSSPNAAKPINTGTRPPSFRKYSFSNGWTARSSSALHQSARRARAIPAA